MRSWRPSTPVCWSCALRHDIGRPRLAAHVVRREMHAGGGHPLYDEDLLPFPPLRARESQHPDVGAITRRGRLKKEADEERKRWLLVVRPRRTYSADEILGNWKKRAVKKTPAQKKNPAPPLAKLAVKQVTSEPAEVHVATGSEEGYEPDADRATSAAEAGGDNVNQYETGQPVGENDQQNGQKAPKASDGRDQDPRHILRHILRECTYFPDPEVRDWLANSAISRFKRTAYEISTDRFADGDSLPEEREAAMKKRDVDGRALGVRFARFLRRANEGGRHELRKALFLAYGRYGKRRHELMQWLLRPRPETPESYRREPSTEMPQTFDDELQETTSDLAEKLHLIGKQLNSEAQHVGSKQRVLSVKHEAVRAFKAEALKDRRPGFGATVLVLRPALTPQLRALMYSQIKNTPPSLRSRMKKNHVEGDISAFNSWGRPLTMSRYVNATKKLYAELLERVIVPLPDREWHRLFNIARNLWPAPQIVQRRRKALSLDEEDEQVQTRWPSSLSGQRSALDLVVSHRQIPRHALRTSSGVMTTRKMQRIYAEVLAHCPLMVFDDKLQDWRVTWGHQKLRERTLPSPRAISKLPRRLAPGIRKYLAGEKISCDEV